MSQKSSLPQAVKPVSQALMTNSAHRGACTLPSVAWSVKWLR
jgi:hypothetical protein